MMFLPATERTDFLAEEYLLVEEEALLSYFVTLSVNAFKLYATDFASSFYFVTSEVNPCFLKHG